MQAHAVIRHAVKLAAGQTLGACRCRPLTCQHCLRDGVVREPYPTRGGAVEAQMDRSLHAVEVPAARPVLAEGLEISI
jgi:hypothetical protein